MKRPKISINNKKCSQPELCLKCLQVCQPCVLNITFTDKDYHQPQNWIIDPVFPQLCLGKECRKCIEICPMSSIAIKF